MVLEEDVGFILPMLLEMYCNGLLRKCVELSRVLSYRVSFSAVGEHQNSRHWTHAWLVSSRGSREDVFRAKRIV